ncbi:unnamed protein product [Toxocara canis]|uniref:SHMT domain-containing protein n=1 Tax=Toxocara canis TaxID=6265 RepID=A0A183VES7_TOXCA|nr:unnamed protein product [Toxocara canis]
MKAVYDAAGFAMSNKCSEGYPGTRYYGGNEYIHQVERSCQHRALKLSYRPAAIKQGSSVPSGHFPAWLDNTKRKLHWKKDVNIDTKHLKQRRFFVDMLLVTVILK